MSNKIKLKYFLYDNPNRKFVTMIPRNSTVAEALEIISQKQKQKYDHLLYDGGRINDDEKIEDYIKNDDDIIFEVSQYYDPNCRTYSHFEYEYMFAINESANSEHKLSKNSPSRCWPPHKSQQIERPITPSKIYSNDSEIKFNFYLTGSTNEHFMIGMSVNLTKSMSLNQCHDVLVDSLRQKNVQIDDKQLLIFLPGGIPFVSGTLGDIYSSSGMDLKYSIYGILTRKISDDILNKSYDNICDLSSPDLKLLISPLCDSSEKGLSDIACLLGYLNNDGKKKDLILRVCAELTNFAPLIISLYKICRKEKVTGFDIATVCSALFTYLRNIFPADKCPNNEVFEYAIILLDTVSGLPSSKDSLPIIQIDFDKKELMADKFILDDHVYVWGYDDKNKYNFTLYHLSEIDFESMKNENKNYTSSILIEADSILSVPGKAIIKGENHEYFYLMKSTSSDPKSKNNVVVIDPITGNYEIKNAESFMKSKNYIIPGDIKESKNYFIDDEEENEFHIVKGQIGEGATSVTYKVIDKRTNTPMCKKVLKYKEGQTSIKDAQRAMNEFQVLYNISHPCICRALGINISEVLEITNKKGQDEEITTIALFLEYLEYGLGDILKTKINNTFKIRIVLDIAHAMNFLHQNGMIHRDLKIENIMLNEFFEVKLVDFGLIRITESVLNEYAYVEESMTKGIGTLSYMSPEMMNEEDYDNKTDVYSFGVVLHFIFTGKLPKQSMKDKLIGKPIDLPSPSSSISSFCIKLISKCLEISPSKRPSFEDILNLMRRNSYDLADDINPSILKKRDDELTSIESKMSIKFTF